MKTGMLRRRPMGMIASSSPGYREFDPSISARTRRGCPAQARARRCVDLTACWTTARRRRTVEPAAIAPRTIPVLAGLSAIHEFGSVAHAAARAGIIRPHSPRLGHSRPSRHFIGLDAPGRRGRKEAATMSSKTGLQTGGGPKMLGGRPVERAPQMTRATRLTPCLPSSTVRACFLQETRVSRAILIVSGAPSTDV